jgi:hypothetical protein
VWFSVPCPPVLVTPWPQTMGREPSNFPSWKARLAAIPTSSMEARSLTVVIPSRRQRRSRSAALNAARLRLGTRGSMGGCGQLGCMWASMRPGMTTLPFASRTSAPSGIGTWPDGPTAVNRSPVMTMVAPSSGGPPLPSTRRAWVTTSGVTWAGGAASTAAMGSSATNRRACTALVFSMLTILVPLPLW